jgi:hypothetical protein
LALERHFFRTVIEVARKPKALRYRDMMNSLHRGCARLGRKTSEQRVLCHI